MVSLCNERDFGWPAPPTGRAACGRFRLATGAVALAMLVAGCVAPGEDATGTTAGVGRVTVSTAATETGPATDQTAPIEQTEDASVEDSATQQPPMVHSAGTQVLGPNNESLNLQCVNIDGWLWPTAYLVSDSGNALFISTAEFVDRLDEVVGSSRADEFWKEWRDAFITEADFESMAALGVNCARLVMYYRAIATLEDGVVELDEAAMAYVDAAVEWGGRHGVYVVLDLHAAPGGQNGVATVADVLSTDPIPRLWEGPHSSANQEATVSMWRTLAQRYVSEPWVAGYDLLNEPALPAGSSSDLVDLYQRIIAAIRSVDKHHMVIVEGDDFAADMSVFTEPLDDNMMYEFHAYALTPFSEWFEPETQDLEPYLRLREEHDRPIWLGEFGEGTTEWIVTMVDLMETNDIGWALFPWKRKQTWFWNPVLQRIDHMPEWYELAAFLAQPSDGSIPAPSVAVAERGMAEALVNIQLSNNLEDELLADAIFGSDD